MIKINKLVAMLRGQKESYN